jgi:hypothetical protein
MKVVVPALGLVVATQTRRWHNCLHHHDPLPLRHGCPNRSTTRQPPPAAVPQLFEDATTTMDTTTGLARTCPIDALVSSPQNVAAVTRQTSSNTMRRKMLLESIVVTMIPAVLSCGPTSAVAAGASSSSTPSSSSSSSPRDTIVAAIRVLQYLLDHWQETVVDCEYADVPRELLERRNKELLLEKAATNALFDKSVSVTSCKIDVASLRQALRSNSPVAQLPDALISVLPDLNNIDNDDDNDKWLERIEDVQRDLIRIDGLAYAARRDYSALNNFDEAEATRLLNQQPSNLLECRRTIQTTVDKLRRIVAALPEL